MQDMEQYLINIAELNASLNAKWVECYEEAERNIQEINERYEKIYNSIYPRSEIPSESTYREEKEISVPNIFPKPPSRPTSLVSENIGNNLSKSIVNAGEEAVLIRNAEHNIIYDRNNSKGLTRELTKRS